MKQEVAAVCFMSMDTGWELNASRGRQIVGFPGGNKKRSQMLLRAENISDFGGESDISRSDGITSI